MPAGVPLQEQLIVSIGEILWDVIANQRHAGGAPFNFAYHSRALGARSALISRVSDDDPGAELVRRAAELQVDTSAIQRDPQHPTGIVTAKVKPNGDVDYIFPKECAWDHIHFGDRDRELVDAASVICFGTLAQRSAASRSAIMAAVSSVNAGTTRFLDLNLRAPYFSLETIKPALQAADMLKINEEELTVLRRLFGLGSDDDTAVLQLTERFDLDTLVLTRGRNGASAWNRTRNAHAAGFDISAIDPVGCGDAFGAAFTTKLITGSSLQEALEYGNVAGAYVATREGATPKYDATDLEEFRSSVPRAAVTGKPEAIKP